MSFNDAPPFGFDALANVNDKPATNEEFIESIGKDFACACKVTSSFARATATTPALPLSFASLSQRSSSILCSVAPR